MLNFWQGLFFDGKMRYNNLNGIALWAISFCAKRRTGRSARNENIVPRPALLTQSCGSCAAFQNLAVLAVVV